MNFFDNIQDAFSQASKKAKQTYDAKMLMHKIKGYEKEVKNNYMDIGKAVHQSRKDNSPIDESIIATRVENIDNLNYRIKQLLKQIETIREAKFNSPKHNYIQTKSDYADIDESDLDEDKYFRFNMKDDDIKIKRTEEGIKAVRICQACNTANSPEAELCINCGNVIKANN